jgi:hypothetical protein
MKTILIGLMIILINLTAFECDAQTSRLPKVMPENVEIGFHRNAGMIFAYTKIEIANLTLTVEEKDGNEKTPRKWSARIEKNEIAALYEIFVENRFDTIKNDERKGIVYDAGSEGVSIGAGPGVSHSISYGPNSPMSGDHKKRYQTVAGAIKALRAKYEEKAKKTADADYVVFEQETNGYYKVFESGMTRTTLSDEEIPRVKALIKKAVDQYNAEPTTPIDLTGFRYQFVPLKNEKGEKEVWANCFCSYYMGEWKTELVFVFAGGNCFFDVYVNLTQNTFDGIAVRVSPGPERN